MEKVKKCGYFDQSTAAGESEEEQEEVEEEVAEESEAAAPAETTEDANPQLVQVRRQWSPRQKKLINY